KDHLVAVHRQHTGFTESCAGRCRDEVGRTSYEWLAELVAEGRGAQRRVLDLACGSGPLLALCAERDAEAELIGVDMSPHELSLAKARLGPKPVALHRTMAQDLSMIGSSSVDTVLCHWALTLMDPLEPVLGEVKRVLRGGGVFAAVVDGPSALAPGYEAVDDAIFSAVSKVAPFYGTVDLGDPRVREASSLESLAQTAFPGAMVSLEPSVMRLTGSPADVAREAMGFFYASFVLPADARAMLFSELETQFAADANDATATFSLPVARLVVRLPSA
ncbi:MAG: class I SAM-dependent methyltransferase, partial [Pseudomonadota bacterium]